MTQSASGFRVRLHNGDFFTLTGEDDEPTVEVTDLPGAIASAEEFLADTAEAFQAGHLSSNYKRRHLDIVAPDGTVLTLDLAKALVAEPAFTD